MAGQHQALELEHVQAEEAAAEDQAELVERGEDRPPPGPARSEDDCDTEDETEDDSDDDDAVRVAPEPALPPVSAAGSASGGSLYHLSLTLRDFVRRGWSRA